jgi:hypothetical protein
MGDAFVLGAFVRVTFKSRSNVALTERPGVESRLATVN